MDQLNRELKNLPTRNSQMQGTYVHSCKPYCPRDDELKTARQRLRSRENYSYRSFSPTGFPTEEESRVNIYDQPHSSTECSSPPPESPPGPEYYNYSVIKNQKAQYSSDASAVVLVPPTSSTKPIPSPKPKKPNKDYKHTENHSNRSSPAGFPIEEEAGENIYDQPHTSTECSSPPRSLEYYNYRAIWKQQSQHGAEASAMVLVPHSPARTAATKPIPPPKPKKPTKDYKHTEDGNANPRSSNSDFQSNQMLY